MADEPNTGAPERDADLTSPDLNDLASGRAAATGTLEPLDEESPVDADGASLAVPSASAASNSPVEPAEPASEGPSTSADTADTATANDGAAADDTEQKPEGTASHDLEIPSPLQELMARGWAEPDGDLPPRNPVAASTARRRA